MLRRAWTGAAAVALVCAACGSSAPAHPPAAPVLTAAPAAATKVAPTQFPLRPGPTGRYLVDQAGRPFMIVGDSPQALVVNASVEEAAGFLANRRAAGFNAVWVNLLCDDYTGGRKDGATRDGIKPFTEPGDLSKPNEAYFARADAIISRAAQDGLAVFLDPIETGGWLEVLRKNGADKAYAYGQYVARRYRRFHNIVWMSGNDFQSWKNPKDDAAVIAVARGIKAVDPGAVQTIELSYLVSASLDDQRWNGLTDLDAAYTYAPTYAEVSSEYARPRHLPIFMVEANYEGEHDFTGPQTLRRQEYWSMLAGADGQFYGNKYTWLLAPGWKTHLDTVGSRELTLMRNFFMSMRWYDLIPDTAHRLVVSGYGAFVTKGSVNNTNYVTAARTPDGALAVAYLPSSRPITVDFSQLSGRVHARWFDPTRGTYTVVAGPRLSGSGTQRFTPPGKNAGGANDWVLVLQRATKTGR